MIVVKKKKHRTKTGSSLLNWFGFLEGRGILGGTTTPPPLEIGSLWLRI
jgi:hypothetical protein